MRQDHSQCYVCLDLVAPAGPACMTQAAQTCSPSTRMLEHATKKGPCAVRSCLPRLDEGLELLPPQLAPARSQSLSVLTPKLHAHMCLRQLWQDSPSTECCWVGPV